MKSPTKVDKIEFELAKLEVGHSLDKRHLIISIWKDYNFFIEGTFSTMLSTARKRFETEEFQTFGTRIKRVK